MLAKPEDLEAEIEAGRPGALYLLAGPAEFLMERFVRRLTTARGAKRIRVDAEEVAPDRLPTEHLVADLFATARVVHVPGAAAWKAEARRKLMKEVAGGGLPAGLALVLCLETTTQPREKLPEGFRAAFFWNPFPSALPRLAEAWIRERGAKAGPGAGARLAELYGTDLRRLDQEIAKLAVPGAGDVTVERVRELCARPPEARAFIAAEAMTSRDPGAGLAALAEVLSSEGPHAVLPVVANRLRRMLLLARGPLGDASVRARVVPVAERLARPDAMLRREERERAEGELAGLGAMTEDPDELAEVHPRALPGLVAHAARASVEELSRALGAIAEADRRLKGDGEDEAWALERVVAILGKRAAPGARPAQRRAR